jgi:hypothetical protein
MKNKTVVLLIAFTGLIATVFQLARSVRSAAADIRAQPVEWVTVSLADPPAPLPDPSVVTVPPVSDLALMSSPIPEHLH